MKYLVLVALVLCLFVVGCTEEQEATAEGVAGQIQTGGQRVAPFLPPPFNYIVHGITVIAAATGAVLAKRRGARADTLEIRVKAEKDVKHNLARAGANLQEAFDLMMTDKKYRSKVEPALEALKEWKKANPWMAKSIGVLDGIRKGLITVDQLTSEAIASVEAYETMSPRSGAAVPI